MSDNGKIESRDDQLVTEVIGSQLEHFKHTNPPCRGMQLPDGILLRHTRSASLYFYLRTAVDNGKIKTHVFATDSPYDRQKASIGSVVTPMFEHQADYNHMVSLEKLIRDWVGFVDPDADLATEFQSFKMDH